MCPLPPMNPRVDLGHRDTAIVSCFWILPSGTCFVKYQNWSLLGQLLLKKIFLLKYKVFLLSTCIWETKSNCVLGNIVEIYSFSVSLLLSYVVGVRNIGGIIQTSGMSAWI